MPVQRVSTCFSACVLALTRLHGAACRHHRLQGLEEALHGGVEIDDCSTWLNNANWSEVMHRALTSKSLY